MLKESAVVGGHLAKIPTTLADLYACPSHVVDVDHATYFVATAQMDVTGNGGIIGRAPNGRQERCFVVAIKRKDKLIRITLIQKLKFC